MAHWDNENFNTYEPPRDIMCATCKFKLEPVEIAGTVVDRTGYGMCGKYERKPENVLWNHGVCDRYEKE